MSRPMISIFIPLAIVNNKSVITLNGVAACPLFPVYVLVGISKFPKMTGSIISVNVHREHASRKIKPKPGVFSKLKNHLPGYTWGKEAIWSSYFR